METTLLQTPPVALQGVSPTYVPVVRWCGTRLMWSAHLKLFPINTGASSHSQHSRISQSGCGVIKTCAWTPLPRCCSSALHEPPKKPWILSAGIPRNNGAVYEIEEKHRKSVHFKIPCLSFTFSKEGRFSSLLESQNVSVEMGLKDPLVWPHCSGQGQLPLFQDLALGTARGGTSTTSLDNLCLCLNILTV